jgi:GH43 family beta-xylosidase
MEFIKGSICAVFLCVLAWFAFIQGCSTTSPQGNNNKKAKTFVNPLLRSGPDPWVIRKNGYYYFMCTRVNRIDIRKTKYIVNLVAASVTKVWSPPKTGPNARNIWGPKMEYINGNWYLYYAATPPGQPNHHRMFVLENASKNPLTSNWMNKGQIYVPGVDQYAIGGTAFKYQGKLYYTWSGKTPKTGRTQNLYIALMKNPWTLKSHRHLISSPTYKWEGKINEGPRILRNKNGKVFLIYNAKGCGSDNYKMGMLVLKKDGDPLKLSDWKKKDQPIFTKDAAHHAYGVGGFSAFKSPDGTQTWFIYHANPQPGQGCYGHRSPRIQRLTWNEDGTPDLGRPVNIFTPIPVPSRDD